MVMAATAVMRRRGAEASQRGLRGVKRTKARRLEASEEAERDT